MAYSRNHKICSGPSPRAKVRGFAPGGLGRRFCIAGMHALGAGQVCKFRLWISGRSRFCDLIVRCNMWEGGVVGGAVGAARAGDRQMDIQLVKVLENGQKVWSAVDVDGFLVFACQEQEPQAWGDASWYHPSTPWVEEWLAE